jgi:hypothetical protein
MTYWIEVETDENYTASENERVRVTTADAVTITVPTTVENDEPLFCCECLTIDYEVTTERAPKDGARVHITDTAQSVDLTYFYRADTAQWVQANDLELTSTVPINKDLHGHLSAMLGVTLAGQEGKLPLATTIAMAEDGERRMGARYGQRIETVTDPGLRSCEWSRLA